MVTKGQLVAQIDPAVFQAKVDQVRANLDSARSAVMNAQAMLRNRRPISPMPPQTVANQNANLGARKSAGDRREDKDTNGASTW